MELTYLMSPALAGGFFTTGPPRKPRLTQKNRKNSPLNKFIQFGLWNIFYLLDLGIYLFILYLLAFPREVFWKPPLISVPRYQSNQNIKKLLLSYPLPFENHFKCLSSYELLLNDPLASLVLAGMVLILKVNCNFPTLCIAQFMLRISLHLCNNLQNFPRILHPKGFISLSLISLMVLIPFVIWLRRQDFAE